MKKILSLIFVSCLSLSMLAGEAEDKKAIVDVIQSAYVDGLQNNGPVEDIEAGFHPGFELLGIRNNELTKWPIYSWVQYHEKRREENPEPPTGEERTTAKFPLVDITGNAAIVKVELYRGGKHIFTDYLSLYKFEEGWKIVNKIYFRHPEESDE